jgi:choline dehydrogenase-like flavoprotein
MPTDFGVRYRQALIGSDHIRVLIDYHVVDLRLNEELDRVDSISLVSRSGRPIQVVAAAIILAAGGIETARLLLASRSQITGGVGNESDLVGRCYMSHISGTYGTIRLRPVKRQKPSFYRLAKDQYGVYWRRRFRLSDQAQCNLQVGNVIGFPARPDISDPRHRDAVLSLMYLWDSSSRGNSRERSPWNVLTRHVGNVMFNHPLAWVSAAKQLRQRSQQPRLPFILPYRSQAQDALFFQAEHAPNPDSRLVLGAQVDEFGVPKIEARIRFSEIDHRTITAFYGQLDHGLRSSGLGYFEYDKAELEGYLEGIISRFNSMAHHLGTTRMSADRRSGVVDSDCRVYSVRNLYISGGSVFPTSGHANPTLTVVALALRLAEHIVRSFKPGA